MVTQDFQALSTARSARARELADLYPASCEVLLFYAAVAAFQERIYSNAINWQKLPEFRETLTGLVLELGPQALKNAATELDDEACRKVLQACWERQDTSSVLSFFARVLLQPYAAIHAEPVATRENCCPRCGHAPQVGVLRPQGDGTALTLVCSLCSSEWSFPRNCCPACGEKREKSQSHYTASGFDHFLVQACDTCRVYIHTVDLGKDGKAIPEVDELAALPLDVWAREQGYRKLQMNLAGI